MQIITAKHFRSELNQRQNQLSYHQSNIDHIVLEIIQNVRKKGDQSLYEYTEKFDHVKLTSLMVTEEEISEAKKQVDSEFMKALKQAYKNIKDFHAKQLESSWFMHPKDGVMLGQKVTPLDSVGIYVPGGKAAYPSTVLMNAIPAKLAGVSQIVITTPPGSDGKVNPYVLAAASECGINRIYKVGGAQAIAALAYGTETVQKVAKIVGPGNAFVAAAKKWVFGQVAIDMIAGPSEICVVADHTANPTFVAVDLLSQAEHDEQATAICITTSETLAKEIQKEVREQSQTLERRAIIEKSLQHYGRIVVVPTLDEAFELVNELAPEHLQLMIQNPFEYVAHIRHAGAIFIGNYAPEPLGDYLAGPNHTLPTNGTAKFSSPLGVYDFMKRSSIIYYSEQALQQIADAIITLADAEGLSAHAQSIQKRKETL